MPICVFFLKFRLDLVRKEYQYCLNRKQHPFIAGYYQLTNSLVKTKWQSLKCLNQEKSTSSSTLVVSEPVTYLILSLNSYGQLFHQHNRMNNHLSPQNTDHKNRPRRMPMEIQDCLQLESWMHLICRIFWQHLCMEYISPSWYHDLVICYGIFVPQITTNMFLMS